MKSKKNSKIFAFNDGLNLLINKVSNIHLGILALLYVLAYLGIESLLQNSVQLYIFTVFLALSGIYFSWFMGGKWTMLYVAFFNIFNVFLFSKLLWSQQVIVSPVVFKAKSFFFMYSISVVFIIMVILWKSPADAKAERQNELIEKERLIRQNFEFIVASRKLKQDLLAQANMVKDELQLIEGAWRSNIHDIINDLPAVKEQELYRQIILPFQDNIINHLRELERKLTFDVADTKLSNLFDYLKDKIENKKKFTSSSPIEIKESGWKDNSFLVNVDANKVWDMLQNIIRNSQAALDLKRIALLTSGNSSQFQPGIFAEFKCEKKEATITIIDNGDGVTEDDVNSLFKDPVLSRKRRNKKPGQGTLFVKFFADRMDIKISVANITRFGEKGLSVKLHLPLDERGEHVAS